MASGISSEFITSQATRAVHNYKEPRAACGQWACFISPWGFLAHVAKFPYVGFYDKCLN